MPIITPDNDTNLFRRLEQAGAAVLTQEDALTQDIRPARIGILNLMPASAMEVTELHWLKNISHTVLQVEPVLLMFDDDPRANEGASRSSILKRYTRISQAKTHGLDGLIITGDNLELDPRSSTPNLLPFEAILYAKQLLEFVTWANANVRSSIYSCLASHFVLNSLYGLEREQPTGKIFGVYEHELTPDSTNTVISGMDDTITAPHSRWGNICVEDVETRTDLEVLAVSKEVGWLLLSGHNSAGNTSLYVQGHPEYGRNDLDNEFQRDKRERPVPPKNYYNPGPTLTWSNDARALHANWISELYKRIS